jgi:hypothetical protein
MHNYLRVTQVLGPYSGINQIPPYILRKASDRGTKVHEICSAIMDEVGLMPFDIQLDGYIHSFNKWIVDKKFTDRPSRLYCNKYMITGEVDGIYLDKNKLILIDIKTSQKENKTWALQGSAYAYLCRKNGIDISRMEFIQLSKDGGGATIYQYQENFDLFLKCLELYNIFFQSKDEEDLIQLI